MKKIKYFFVFLVLAVLNFLLFLNIKKEPNIIGIFFVLVLFWSMVMVLFAFIKEVFNEKNN